MNYFFIKKILGGPSKTSRDRPGKARRMRAPGLRTPRSNFKSNENQALLKKNDKNLVEWLCCSKVVSGLWVVIYDGTRKEGESVL